MPMYLWIDCNPENRKNGEEPLRVEVLRKFDDYQLEPQEDEIPKEHLGKEFKWERIIDTAPQVTRAPGFGSKGNW